MSEEGKNVSFQEPGSEAIGGWLRFFQALVWITAAIYACVLLATPILLLLDDNIQLGFYLSLLGEPLPNFVFAVLILRILKVRSIETPQKIKAYLGWLAVASFCVSLVFFIAFKNGYVPEKPTSFWGDLLWYLIWSAYFKKSVRVKQYYGENAE